MAETVPISGHPAREGEEGPVEVRGVDEAEQESIAQGILIRALEGEDGSGDEEDMTEEGKLASMFFKCIFCLEPMNEPMVLGCGHIFCTKCFKEWIATKPTEPPVCPTCKLSCPYLPHKCELIGNLIKKLQPLKHQTMETIEASTNAQKIQLTDLMCLSCKDILYEPSALNCGHVFCMSCLLSTGGTTIACKACGALHRSSPKVCTKLNSFIQTYYPLKYKSKADQIQVFTDTSALEPHVEEAKLSEIHVGIGCDACGIYPIQGSRYSCKICEDFDLCDKCSKMDLVHGRSGQLHSIEHALELNDSFLFDKVIALRDQLARNAEGPEQLQGVNAGFFW